MPTMSYSSLGEAYVEVGANTTKFRADLEKGVKAGLAQAQTQAQGFGASLRASLAGASDALGQFGRSASTTGRKLLTSVTLPLVGIGVAAFKMSADFESAMAKVEGLVGVAHDQVVSWGAEVKNLAVTYGKSATEAADALYFITSSGIEAADTMSVLETSLKAAAIGLGDTATIATLVTSAMNAYKLSGLGASKATDILVAAVREGKLEADALANSMGFVLPLASAMGVSFDQVGAAFAAMSLTGTDASTAATQLRQILSSLQKPTEEAEKTLTALGLSSAGLRAELREKGLLATLQTLSTAFGDNEVASAQVFGNIRALTGVMSLMGENSAGTARIFDELTKTTGSMDTAFAVIAKTAAFKLSKAIADLKVALMSLGDILSPYIVKFGEQVRKFSEWFRELDDRTKKFILIGAGIAATLGPVILIIGALASSIAILINPVTLLVAGIGALVAGAVYAYVKFEAFRAVVNAFGTVLKAYGTIVVRITEFLIDIKWAIVAATVGLVAMNAQLLISTGFFVAGLFPILATIAGVTALATGVVLLSQKLDQGRSKLDSFKESVSEVVNPHLRDLNNWLITAARNTGIFEWQNAILARRLTAMAAAYESVTRVVVLSQNALDARRSAIVADNKATYASVVAATTFSGATGSATDKVKALAEKIKELRDSFGDEFKDALTKAGDVLNNAKQVFTDFAASVSKAITESFSFKDAYAAGEESGGGFIAALTAQSTKIKDYGVLVDRLLAAGLKDPALQQVLTAGIDAGSAIARELLASADGVLRANQLAEEVTAIGDKIGLNAAGRFRQAGIDLATTFVTAIGEIISAAKFKLSSVGLNAAQLKKLKTQFGVDIEFAFSALPQLANGVILPGRTGGYNINAGEDGDEAVIPITRPRRALELMEESGLANLARANSNTMSPALHIENATFATPSDADLVAQRVMAGFKAMG